MLFMVFRQLPACNSVLCPGHFIFTEAHHVHFDKCYLCAHSQSSINNNSHSFLEIFKVKHSVQINKDQELYIIGIHSSVEILINTDATITSNSIPLPCKNINDLENKISNGES